jgi:hypothetical protein
MGTLRAIRPWQQWIASWGYDINGPEPNRRPGAVLPRIREMIGDPDPDPRHRERHYLADQPGLGHPLLLGAGILRRRRGAPASAFKRPGLQYLHPGCVQPRLEARLRHQRPGLTTAPGVRSRRRHDHAIECNLDQHGSDSRGAGRACLPGIHRGTGSWWNPGHQILRAELAEMVFEPQVGGYIIDRYTDGSECRWARVLVYDSPHRVCFSWDVNMAWQLETDPARASEIGSLLPQTVPHAPTSCSPTATLTAMMTAGKTRGTRSAQAEASPASPRSPNGTDEPVAAGQAPAGCRAHLFAAGRGGCRYSRAALSSWATVGIRPLSCWNVRP